MIVKLFSNLKDLLIVTEFPQVIWKCEAKSESPRQDFSKRGIHQLHGARFHLLLVIMNPNTHKLYNINCCLLPLNQGTYRQPLMHLIIHKRFDDKKRHNVPNITIE